VRPPRQGHSGSNADVGSSHSLVNRTEKLLEAGGIRPAILTSQLAPVVIRYGGRLPGLAG